MDAEMVIAGCAVIIALASLVVSIREGAQSRKHNRLSLLPCMRIDRLLLSPGIPPSICLLSTGVGPAIIRSFSVTVDGVKVVDHDGRPAVKALEQIGITHRKRTYTPAVGDTFAPGESKNLIEFIEFSDDSERPALRMALKRLEFHIVFASVYGEVFSMQRMELA